MVFFVAGGKAATEENVCAEAGKEISTDLFSLGLLGRVAVANGNLADAQWNVSDQVFEDVVALAQSFEDRFRKRSIAISCIPRARRLIAAGNLQIIETVRMAYGQRAQQHGIHHTEHRRVSSDPQSQSHNGDEREPRAFAQLPPGVTNVLEKAGHIYSHS